MLVTTTPGIEGRRVTEYLGVVTAQGVLGVNAFKDVGAGMRNIFGGRAKSYENELASGVSDALAEMKKQAAMLCADAVIGVYIDYETVGKRHAHSERLRDGSETGLTRAYGPTSRITDLRITPRRAARPPLVTMASPAPGTCPPSPLPATTLKDPLSAAGR